ncbi:MAG: oligosaccharide flippase family protein [Lachnospiraceae bacterium]|nr:oligosaccharide flippase family protein [Lachnospiraceae bacterium]
MSKNTIIRGTLILTITGLCTKLLGFYYRIFLTKLIGVQQLGIYQLVFPLYILMFSFCGQGFCQALTKHVSAYLGRQKYNCMNRTLSYALIISVSLSIVTSSLVYANANTISLAVLKNTECTPLLQLLCFAIPFVVFKAIINSFFLGKNEPKYQGITQLFEQIIRISSAAFLAYFLVKTTRNARLAVVAVVIGELSATILTTFFYIIDRKRNTISKKNKNSDNNNQSFTIIRNNLSACTYKTVAKGYINDAIPMSVNSFIFALFSSFEAVLLPNVLYAHYDDKTFAMEIFGIVTGIVLPFLLFPATITTSLSSMLLPSVSFAEATNNYKKIKKTLFASVFFCLSLGMIASILYMVLAKYICNVAFHNEMAGILLRNMSFLCPFIYISGNLSAFLNGMDMAFTNLMYNIIGISVRIACSFILVPIFGIKAYIYGIAASYILIDMLQFITLQLRIKNTKPTADMVSPDTHNN